MRLDYILYGVTGLFTIGIFYNLCYSDIKDEYSRLNIDKLENQLLEVNKKIKELEEYLTRRRKF